MEGDGADRFEAFVDALAEVFGHADRVRPLRDYCMGLLTPAERKSVEPLAAVTAPLAVPGVRGLWRKKLFGTNYLTDSRAL